jgi:transcriptional regulator with XRE-family HTH domain
LKFSQYAGRKCLETSVAFGRVLRRLRKEKKLSQVELGLSIPLQGKYVSLLEKGEYQPKLETIFRIADALECSPFELIKLVEDEKASDVKTPLRKRVKPEQNQG